MKLASIQTITDIRPIEGADRIEAATVLGYQTAIKKGEFQAGDSCVWHEPDTVVAERPEYEFLRKQGFRLKVSRFKGQVSQGLALPMSILPVANSASGDDVTIQTGIKKYEKPLSANLVGIAKGAFPTWEGEFQFTLPELVALANAQDYLPGTPAEGIVIRPIEEARSTLLESGRLSAKVISERYALKHGE